MNESTVKLAFLGTGLVAGGVGGYYLAKRKFRLLAEEEIESVRDAFRELQKVSRKAGDEDRDAAGDQPRAEDLRGPLGDPGETGPAALSSEFVAYNRMVKQEAYVPSDSEVDNRDVVKTPSADVEVTVGEDNHDIQVTVKHDPPRIDGYSLPGQYFDPAAGKPYPTDVDVFMMNSEDFEQHQMTWYAGDQTLVFDDTDVMVDDLAIVGGLAVLDTFRPEIGPEGHIIYVRDDERGQMFEIQRDSRRYSAFVLE